MFIFAGVFFNVIYFGFSLNHNQIKNPRSFFFFLYLLLKTFVQITIRLIFEKRKEKPSKHND